MIVFRIFVISTILSLVGVYCVTQSLGASQTIFHVIIGYSDGRIIRHTLVSEDEYSSLLRQAYRIPNVMFVEKEVLYHIASKTPNDPYFASQSNLSVIDTPQAWDYTTGRSSTIIAVLDSGVEIDHEDILPNSWVNKDEISGNSIDDDNNGYIDDTSGWDFVGNDRNPRPEFTGSSVAGQHGTVVAGIAGAKGNNALGISGINWSVSIMPIRVLDKYGTGSSYNVAQGILYAADNGAHVINLSFVGTSSSQAIMQAIQVARNKGAIVIAAAGNDSLNLNTTPRYPVCNSGVIGVAALNQSNEKSSFSNYGSSCIDVSAPGEALYSTVSNTPGSGSAALYSVGWAGTSFAAPHVSGVAALARAVDSDIQVDQLETLLSSVAVNSISSQNGSIAPHLGGGIISALKAVSQSRPPTVTGTSIVTFPLSGGGPHLRGFTQDGSAYMSVFLEDSSFHGGGSIATADIDADGTDEILYGLGSGTTSRIRIFSSQGIFKDEFLAFSSPQNGIRVAGGDTNGDGLDDIIAVREQGASADVRIFTASGSIRKRFFAYPDSFSGGMSIGAGDVTGDGIDEIILGTGNGGLPRVQVFTEDGNRLYQFFAYGLGFRGGINVAAGDVDGDGVYEIMTAPIAHGGPHVRVFEADGSLKGDFFAYGEGFHGGVSIASGDINGDGKDDIITGARKGGGPHVRVWANFKGTYRISDFFAYGEGFHGGINVGSIRAE